MSEEKEQPIGTEVNKRKGTTDFNALDWLAGKIAPATSDILKNKKGIKNLTNEENY